MSSYRKTVNDIKIASYEEVKELYLRVSTIADEMRKESAVLHFQFRCGDITYVAESIEDFTKDAYGATDFHLVSMQLMYFLPGKEQISMNYLSDVSVTASNKVLLEDLIKRLNITSKTNATHSKQQIQNSGGNTIIINGNGNVVANAGGVISGNDIENEQDVLQPEEKQSKIKDFFSGVLQNIVSNIVWYLLGLIAAAVIAYISMQ